jgi:hypothetical protein
MGVRQVNRPTFEVGYLGPGLNGAGVLDFLPYSTIGAFAGGGGYVSIGWLFWFVSIEWQGEKAR